MMNIADMNYKLTCKDILDNGYDNTGEEVRPKWSDGTPAYTIRKTGIVNRYDLSTQFPALSLRPIAFKSCIDEILWIWQKKSSNVHDLNSHIWDSWADESGFIGKAYGYQVGQKFRLITTTYDKLRSIKEDYKTHPRKMDGKEYKFRVDQTDYILHELKYNKNSRRIIGNLYNVEDLDKMNLEPCCYSITLMVTGDKLDMILNQRSNDILTAGNWNVVQYAVLQHMFAQVSGLKVGELIHVIADAHIYDRHVDSIKMLLERNSFPAPKLWINPEVKNFYDFTVDDFKLIDYKTHEQIKNIPVAI